MDVRHEIIPGNTTSNLYQIINPIIETIRANNIDVFKILASEHDLSGQKPRYFENFFYDLPPNFSWVFYEICGYNIQFAFELLKNGYCPKSHDREKDQALMIEAIYRNDINYVRFLFENGFDFNFRFGVQGEETGAFECIYFDNDRFSGAEITKLIQLLYELGASPVFVDRQAHGKHYQDTFYGKFCVWFFNCICQQEKLLKELRWRKKTLDDNIRFETFYKIFEKFKIIYQHLEAMKISSTVQVAYGEDTFTAKSLMEKGSRVANIL